MCAQSAETKRRNASVIVNNFIEISDSTICVLQNPLEINRINAMDSLFYSVFYSPLILDINMSISLSSWRQFPQLFLQYPSSKNP